MHGFVHSRVADVMTYRPVTLLPGATLAEAAALFARYDFELLPVTEDGCLRGVVGKRDLLKAFAFGPGVPVPPYEEILRQPVGQVMDRTPETVMPATPVTVVLHRMVATGRCSFPVVVRALVIGIVTRTDITRALRRPGAATAATG